MSLSLLVKPVSGACNLRCEYCFYREFFQKRKNTTPLDAKVLASFIESVKRDGAIDIDLAFQGGEPLLRGIEFFEELFASVGTDRISFSIQTNATLLDERWIRLFKKYNVLVGVSVDGDKADNALRKCADGTDSFDRVIKSISLLQAHKANHNLVCVVSRKNVDRLGAIYDFFSRTLNEKFLQFIPCLTTSTADLSLSQEEYYRYLQVLFDRYYGDIMRGNYVSIRYFDELIRVVCGQKSAQCGMNGRCENQLVIESDGSVYPCDFYCDEEHLLGNIATDAYRELFFRPVAERFTRKETAEKCKKCKYYRLCQGGCRRRRRDRDYCASVYKFFDNNIYRLLSIANLTKE